jgi:Uma2 family endonuclease
MNGVATALPSKNDSGLIKKLKTYATEIGIKMILILESKTCFDKYIKVEKLKITLAAV